MEGGHARHSDEVYSKSTEDVLRDHSSHSWTHTLSFVMILGGWVGGVCICRVLLSWVNSVLVVFQAAVQAFPPNFSTEESIPDCKQA